MHHHQIPPDAMTFGGSFLAMVAGGSDWTSYAGLVVAVIGVVQKFREHSLEQLKNQNMRQAAQIAQLQCDLERIRVRHADGEV